MALKLQKLILLYSVKMANKSFIMLQVKITNTDLSYN